MSRRYRVFRRRDLAMASLIISVFIETLTIFMIAAFKIAKFTSIQLYKLGKRIYLWYKYRETGYSYSDIVNRVETVSPRGFEILCANVFRANGHRVKVTEATNDGGKDIIVDNLIYVECKHYAEANFVGREICQKLVGSSISDEIKHGIVITTGTIHSNAFRYAEKINSTGDFYLELWDKKKLLEYIDSVENRKIPYVMNIIEA